MQLREGIINLSITCALVVFIALIAVFFRNSQAPQAVPRATNAAVVPLGATTVAATPSHAERPVEANFRSFPSPQILDSPTNEADTLCLKVSNEECVFVLYFVDALDATATHPERVSAQARYFGKATTDAVIETGKEARDYVLKLLREHRFQLLTRWERVPNSGAYYALVWVESEPGRWTYLADMLVRQGFARIEGVTTPLPDDKHTLESYLFDLRAHATYARQRKLGIWAKVKA